MFLLWHSQLCNDACIVNVQCPNRLVRVGNYINRVEKKLLQQEERGELSSNRFHSEASMYEYEKRTA